MRIEICGGIGAGKTTLTSLLEKHGFNIVLENFKANPFWQSFYSNPNKFNFETEITFLLQHYHEIKISSEKYKNFVCDFSFCQDLAYAKMGLQGNRLNVFEQVMKESIVEVGQPNLLICLICEPKTLLERIQKRGRNEETLIDESFLTALNKDIYAEAKKQGYSNKVIYIDSDRYNFVTNLQDQEEVIKQINTPLI